MDVERKTVDAMLYVADDEFLHEDLVLGCISAQLSLKFVTDDEVKRAVQPPLSLMSKTIRKEVNCVICWASLKMSFLQDCKAHVEIHVESKLFSGFPATNM